MCQLRRRSDDLSAVNLSIAHQQRCLFGCRGIRGEEGGEDSDASRHEVRGRVARKVGRDELECARATR
jgi:hypothetical protein